MQNHSSVSHLHENVAAASLALPAKSLAALDGIARRHPHSQQATGLVTLQASSAAPLGWTAAP